MVFHFLTAQPTISSSSPDCGASPGALPRSSATSVYNCPSTHPSWLLELIYKGSSQSAYHRVNAVQVGYSSLLNTQAFVAWGGSEGGGGGGLIEEACFPRVLRQVWPKLGDLQWGVVGVADGSDRQGPWCQFYYKDFPCGSLKAQKQWPNRGLSTSPSSNQGVCWQGRSTSSPSHEGLLPFT